MDTCLAHRTSNWSDCHSHQPCCWEYCWLQASRCGRLHRWGKVCGIPCTSFVIPSCYNPEMIFTLCSKYLWWENSMSGTGDHVVQVPDGVHLFSCGKSSIHHSCCCSLCVFCSHCGWTWYTWNQSLSKRSWYPQHVWCHHIDRQGELAIKIYFIFIVTTTL